MEPIRRREDKCELELAQDVGWVGFAGWAKRFVKSQKAKVRHKYAGPDAHLWEISINNIPFNLCYVDFPDMVWIATKDVAGEAILKSIQAELNQQTKQAQ